MLKIKDATGEVVGTLKDEDSAPDMKTKEALDKLTKLTEEDGLSDNELEGEEDATVE